MAHTGQCSSGHFSQGFSTADFAWDLGKTWRDRVKYFSLVRLLLLVSTLDLRLILGGVGKAKGQISPGLKSPIDFLTSHRCTKYYIFLLHANNQ